MRWSPKSLDELGEVKRGKSKHRPRDAAHLYGGDYPFIQTGDVKHSGLYVTAYSQTYSEAGLAQSKLWPKGTLCITIAANIADTAILSFDACFPDSIIGFQADPKKSDVRFVKYLMDTLKRHFRQFSQGAAQDNLSLEKLISLKFPVPDVAVQKNIANALSAYDDLIKINEKKMALLEESARLIYKEWFIQFRYPGHEKVKLKDGVPERWKKGVISDFYNTGSGGTPSRKNEEYFGGDINWIKTQELLDCFIFEADEKITDLGLRNSSAKLYPPGTILVAMYGATIGQTGILDCESSTNQACCALITKEGYNLTPYFTFLFFQINKTNLLKLAQGAAQANVSQEIIRDMKFILPDDKVLKDFNERINPIYDLVKNISKQNMNLSKARDLLLPRLMSGDIEL